MTAKPTFRRRVYVAGPYRHPDPVENTHRAIKAGDQLWELGFAPFIPHAATMAWHLVCPRPEAEWLEYDNQFLAVCDGLLRLPGFSAGADAEVKLAESLAIPVFYNVQELLDWKRDVWSKAA